MTLRNRVEQMEISMIRDVAIHVVHAGIDNIQKIQIGDFMSIFAYFRTHGSQL